jgi:hypothetical protein
MIKVCIITYFGHQKINKKEKWNRKGREILLIEK